MPSDTFVEKKFTIPALNGISPEQLTIHLGLYGGYVKNLNTLIGVRGNLMKDAEKNAYALSEVHRRFAFEFDGMRMHEYYFDQWENGAEKLNSAGPLAGEIAKAFGSVELWEAQFKATGLMRGIGWTVLYFDPKTNTFHNAWVGDHEIGQLAGLPVILALDMWEHAYMVDYTPAEKKKYIDAFFSNLNWKIPESRFAVFAK